MLVPSSLVAKVSHTVHGVECILKLLGQGAASDKVAALEKAGVIVTDSPAKIGVSMLEVSLARSLAGVDLLTSCAGDEDGRARLDTITLCRSLI